MDTNTLLVGVVAGPGGGFDINAADCDHWVFSSKVIHRQAALGYHLQVSSRGKLPRSTPPHLAAAFLLPQLHHLICWQAYPLNQMPLRGLPPQDYLDLSTSPGC